MIRLKNLVAFFILLSSVSFSCKKPADLVGNPLLEQYFETNVLNRNFTVSLATSDSSDYTSDYVGYTFVLQKDDYYHGPLKATKGSQTYMGTWSSNEDYSKLIILLPTPPPEFTFLNRSWRFTSKSFPTLKLSPWGSVAPIVLHMYRQ